MQVKELLKNVDVGEIYYPAMKPDNTQDREYYDGIGSGRASILEAECEVDEVALGIAIKQGWYEGENLQGIAKTVATAIREGRIIKSKGEEKKYPCHKCGKMRTKAEGGTIYKVCKECKG